jgi:hypothetical protein
MRLRVPVLATAIALALAAAACGDTDEETPSSLSVSPGDTTTAASATTATAPPTTAGASTTPSSTSAAPDTSPSTSSQSTSAPSTSTPSTTAELPGEAIDFGPRAGDVLAVVGVDRNDVLNLRAAPGTDQEVLVRLAPLTDDLLATGHTRMLPRSFWIELDADGTVGWASLSFLGYLGGTDDATAELTALAGETPVAETLVDLATDVAALVASDEPRSRIRVSGAPAVGDLGEVTVDVVGIGDDSVLGYRLRLFATPHESGEAWVLKSVERTVLCARGTDGELCV